MILIKNLRIDDSGDPSVGIFPCFWLIQGDLYLEDEDDLNEYIALLRAAWEYTSDGSKLHFTYDKEYVGKV